MIITIERNEQTGRFHPFVWYESPMPSADGKNPIQRFKSKMHHTRGFVNEAEARMEVPGLARSVQAQFGSAVIRIDQIGQMTWDPADVPAAVRWMERE